MFLGDQMVPPCSPRCVTEFDASPVEFQSSVGTIFLCSSIALPCRNRVACSVSLKQDNLPFDFTAHSSGFS